MSKYTTELRYICETAAGLAESTGYNNVNDVIAAAREKIFDFSYPIFDEAYKEVLETKILKHFYTQEIGSETVGRWKLMLDATMNEIMPWYNKLYESGLQDVNPLLSDDIEESYIKTGSGTQNSNENINETKEQENRENASDSSSANEQARISESSESSGESTDNTGSSQRTSENNFSSQTGEAEKVDKYSDTPQGAVTDIINDQYLTNARIINDETGASTSGFGTSETSGNEERRQSAAQAESRNEEQQKNNKISSTKQKNSFGQDHSTTNSASEKNDTSTENYIFHRIGRSGLNIIDIMERLRDTMIDIDMMVIEDLKPLFMRLW